MINRKFTVAMAALLLGAQLGSPSAAAISEQDLLAVEALVAAGEVEELMAFLAMNPELLEIQGALGEALRSFQANPTSRALRAVAVVASGGRSLASLVARDRESPSIY